MSTRTANRRRQHRLTVSPSAGATVEFVHPNGSPDADPAASLPLVDLSPSGVSFAVEAEGSSRPLEIGASLPGSSIRIGTVTIRGELVVMHVSPGADGRMICGSLFYPDSDDDLVKLKSVVAGIEAAGVG